MEKSRGLSDSMEELQARHRKELKDLQGRITQKKKSATKKTRKGINDECERLQRELLDKQHAEISALLGEAEPQADDRDNLDLENGAGHSIQPTADDDISLVHLTSHIYSSDAQITSSDVLKETPKKKPNRQKARLARRAAEQEAEAARAAEEATHQTDHRGNERKNMDATFSRLGLKEEEISPDGHCLYSAVATQLVNNGIPLSAMPPTTGFTDPKPGGAAGYHIVRDVTASYITNHADDFAPFVEETLPEYVRKIRATAEWGGHLELQAIARAYNVHVNVVQGDGRIEKFEPQNSNEEDVKTIWLAYYRHTYGLGEHYNALTKAS
ncbi:OTU domain-containing protein 6B [Histoplasma capsulatum G186AR]|uniref:OTU domain-containing protein 6B n=2 Tax=Ajellomyces capsulatus TaxID=5037 RepID=C0NMM7_AJECG|nr:OTU domain-containing protein 6B [Histoplasma capsulatum G186AR]EEH07125.1 OTU domain-containing protein 6B [Histoplasma capsulatum G186AR]